MFASVTFKRADDAGKATVCDLGGSMWVLETEVGCPMLRRRIIEGVANLFSLSERNADVVHIPVFPVVCAPLVCSEDGCPRKGVAK